MDYVKPNQVMDDMIEAGAAKARLRTSQMIIRGMLSGAILACATTLAFPLRPNEYTDGRRAPVSGWLCDDCTAGLRAGNWKLRTLAFNRPAKEGFRCLYACELRMGNSRTCDRLSDLWGLYTLTATRMGTDMSHPLVQMIIDTSETKTIGYKALGVSGMLVVIKAMLCNWMVTLGVVMAFTSSSTIGKIVAMWRPSWSFRSRLRACRGKYVCDTGGHDARGGCQHGRLVALEPNPRINR